VADPPAFTTEAAKIRNVRVVSEYGGSSSEAEILLSFSGVGLKCANLVLGIACNQLRVSADVHVDRVTNRWGYVHTRSPEQTSQALEAKLPEQYWVEINRLLVPFGKHICGPCRAVRPARCW
jgi:endonuclease-3